jgi:3-hydroxyisobutyrate dehydrogenase-like beta-hydroxyacid dehydrogenase
MGSALAGNLLKSGYSVVVNDVDSAKAATLTALGATPAGSPAEVASASRCTVAMVETTGQTEEVILGVRGIIHGASLGHLVVVMSTIDPKAARRMHDRLREAGVGMLDAPVSGGRARDLG